MLTLPEILAALREVGDSFPVDTWKVDGFHVWPMVRYDVANWNFELISREPVAASTSASGLGAMLRTARGALEASVRDRRATELPHRADALLVSDGVSFVNLGGRQFDRFCDPIRELLGEAGATTAMVTPLDRFRTPRYSPSGWVQPFIDVARVAGFAAARSPFPRPKVELDGFVEARALLDARGAKRVPTEEDLVRVTRYLTVYRTAWEAVLAAYRPRVVFVPCYIGAERQALIAACHRRGIASVDVQHGAAGATHWAYSGVVRAPPGGYELVPSHFWCWSEDDATAIREWALPGGGHETIVAGIPMLEAWRAGTIPYREEARALLDREVPAGIRTQVAFALSGFESPVALEQMVRFCVGEPATFCWFRTHPVRPEQGPALEAMLREARVRNANVHLASTLPLYAVLEQADVLVVELSSSAFEAAQLGVPVVLLSEATGVVYKDLVSSGIAVVAGFSNLAQAIAQQRPRKGSAPRAGDVAAGIRRFVKLARP